MLQYAIRYCNIQASFDDKPQTLRPDTLYLNLKPSALNPASYALSITMGQARLLGLP